MQIFDAEAIVQALDWQPTIEALAGMFRTGCIMPVRHHHHVEGMGPEGILLIMPAWQSGQYIGVKIVNVFPGNGSLGLPAIDASYLLYSGRTGQMLALMDGGELTARRTAAASVLAAGFLARADATRLLVVGAGRIARNLAEAYAATRPLQQIVVWSRDAFKGEALARQLQRLGHPAVQTADLAAAVSAADIITCATLSQTPLIRGEWLREGTHVDLVGGFTPTMREADDVAIRRATVAVDTRSGAMSEAGDIVLPLANGVLTADGIVADLYDLCLGNHPGRRTATEITLFKSVGAAIEDLAAAIRVRETSLSTDTTLA